ncbi:MAG: enoyl-CoA hydratase/isomerase family protein [Dehalococcoidia bacterium]
MDTVQVERSEELPGLVTVTLNRPEKLNAISHQMHEELQEVCHRLTTDADARVVILTGAGRAFSAGADLGSRGRAGTDTATLRALQQARGFTEERVSAAIGSRTAAALEGLAQVTIGAINGLCIGGAVVFASCLDLRLAAASAWFSIPEVDLDIPLTWNALPRLMRELGPARTKELVLSCDRFSAEEALRWGFVNHVVPDDELLPRARALAAKLLAKDAFAVAATKAATNALAQLMVPGQATYSDPDLLLLASRLRAEAAARMEP